MHADPELELFVWLVADAERPDGLPQGQAHAGYLPGVVHPVPHGQARDHHVRVADGLHLEEEKTKSYINCVHVRLISLR